MLDKADLLAGSATAEEESPGREEVDGVLAGLSPDERKVADCYATTGLTWKQAALKAGQPTSMGERVRRELKRLGTEHQRRRRSQAEQRWTRRLDVVLDGISALCPAAHPAGSARTRGCGLPGRHPGGLMRVAAGQPCAAPGCRSARRMSGTQAPSSGQR
ncbi:hypothetical protein [Streptomyces sp. AC558_RSS880]|uniref:hypothetical protein n=1 Tax=Streptomyces sp. AC558_RSS880 TaxID=2823687 RepID=UPI001C22815A|nr:hypothetical protein [Streptomyces sp. AC558_RSS880]